MPTIHAVELKTIEVHNAWTIYGIDDDGHESDQPLAMLSRPQDWGEPRWTYHRFRFEWATAGDANHYISHFHAWTDLKRQPHEYPTLFASLIVQIMMPGSPEELCGRTHLHEDDFWDEAWGEQPPFYGEDDDRIEF